MNTTSIHHRLSAFLFIALCMGCSQPSEENPSKCGQGVEVQLDTQSICAYKQAIVIETGFECPASHPNRQDLGDFTACSQQVGGLDEQQIEQVRDDLVNEHMWDIAMPMPRLDMAVDLSRPDMDSSPEDMESPDLDTPDMPTVIQQQKIDLLWVVDNSFSMCEEQALLRRSMQSALTPLIDKDFHIAVTTTHAPEGAASIEPVAVEAHIQSTPQPVPGNNQGCLRDGNGFGPLRESLDVAKSCLADTSTAGQYDWTDQQIDCALNSSLQQSQTGCVVNTALPDSNMDGRHDVFDLFPSASEYIVLPKVLRREDYIMNGVMDANKLLADLQCATAVGTRGDGFEKGLRAAVNAVSPTLTGGAVGAPGANTTAPNHGFIREDSSFAVVFITDENDCSHDGSLMELGNECGANVCEYMNSPQAEASGISALISPEQLANELVSNLAAIKGNTFSSDDIFVGTITGTSERYDQPFPTCSVERPDIMPTCTTQLGASFSGDRYERFADQFANHYPNTTDVGFEPFGWMCMGDFSPALQGIGMALSQ